MGSLTNQILISMPHMADPYFSKAVVYVCEHNKEGAMGMIINKQFKAPDLKELFEKLYIGDDTIHSLVNDIFFGGPILLERGIVLHDATYKSEGTINISDHISMTSQQHVLKELQHRPDIPFKLMLGHSGWSQGQLEREIENGDWLMQTTTQDFIFKVTPEQMWQQAIGSLGMDLGPSLGISGQA
jgi:putative transcriptional regulator